MAELRFDDLRRLREVVKTIMRFHGWPPQFVNDYEADKWIEAQGPEVAARMTKEAVDNGIAEKKLFV